jgi:hypothetical protein
MRRVVCTGAIALAALVGLSDRWMSASLARLVIVASGGPTGYGVSASGSRHAAVPAQPEPIFMPYLVTHTGLGLAVSCVTYRTITDPSQATYATLLATAQARWALLARYPRCTAVTGQPRALATAWYAFVHARLPLPSAGITPGVGVVNLPLLLEASGVTHASATVPTPEGPLGITASGTIWLETPTGLRLPTSLIPRYPGTVSVTAVEQWTGTYHLGATTGALPQLVITGHSASVAVIALATQLNSVS